MRYGHRDQLSWICLEGLVRYTECRELKAFLERVVLPEMGETMVIDLRDVNGIDSTGLGLLALIGRYSLSHFSRRAVILCPEGAVAQTLRAMRFDKLFTVTESLDVPEELPLEEVQRQAPQENLANVMLEAHKELSSVDERNKARFTDVVEQLENATHK